MDHSLYCVVRCIIIGPSRPCNGLCISVARAMVERGLSNKSRTLRAPCPDPVRLHIRPFEHLRAHVRETTHAQKSQGQAPFTQEGGRGALGAPASRTEGRCSRAQLRQSYAVRRHTLFAPLSTCTCGRMFGRPLTPKSRRARHPCPLFAPLSPSPATLLPFFFYGRRGGGVGGGAVGQNLAKLQEHPIGTYEAAVLSALQLGPRAMRVRPQDVSHSCQKDKQKRYGSGRAVGYVCTWAKPTRGLGSPRARRRARDRL